MNCNAIITSHTSHVLLVLFILCILSHNVTANDHLIKLTESEFYPKYLKYTWTSSGNVISIKLYTGIIDVYLVKYIHPNITIINASQVICKDYVNRDQILIDTIRENNAWLIIQNKSPDRSEVVIKTGPDGQFEVLLTMVGIFVGIICFIICICVTLCLLVCWVSLYGDLKASIRNRSYEAI
jgi:hypothetical protein